jgi:hypothetical protein
MSIRFCGGRSLSFTEKCDNFFVNVSKIIMNVQSPFIKSPPLYLMCIRDAGERFKCSDMWLYMLHRPHVCYINCWEKEKAFWKTFKLILKFLVKICRVPQKATKGLTTMHSTSTRNNWATHILIRLQAQFLGKSKTRIQQNEEWVKQRT